MSVHCARYDRKKRVYLTSWHERQIVDYDQARKMTIERILDIAGEEETQPGIMLIVLDYCVVKVKMPGCFEGSDCSRPRAVLYLQAKEEVTGEDAQRIMDLAQSLSPSPIDTSKAKVLKLVFKVGRRRIIREWTETDVLYIGDMHTFCEYCLEPDPTFEDIVAYALWTPERVIPVDVGLLGKYAW